MKAGWNMLFGPSTPADISNIFKTLLNRSKSASSIYEYGDGTTAKGIVETLIIVLY